jgi:hypothetical protein
MRNNKKTNLNLKENPNIIGKLANIFEKSQKDVF